MKHLMLKLAIVGAGLSIVLAPAAFASTQDLITGKACKVIVNSNSNVVVQPVNDNVPGCSSHDPAVDKPGGLANEILDTFFYIAGTVSVIFAIVAGIQYITSDGNSQRIDSAKQTLLYAIIGLIITAFAAAIAGFVIKTVVGS